MSYTSGAGSVIRGVAAKRMKALAAGWVFVCFLCLGQAQTSTTNGITAPGTLYPTTRSNLASISNAVRIASGLRVGMAGADVWKYMQDHGMVQTNIYSISLDRGRTMAYPYPLEGGATLMLDMHCTKGPTQGLFGWSAPVFDRAYIQSQSAEIISITPSNRPQGRAAHGSRPIRLETNSASFRGNGSEPRTKEKFLEKTGVLEPLQRGLESDKR